MKTKKGEELAYKIVNMSRDHLMVSFRFLDRALYRLEFKAASQNNMGTNGEIFFLNPVEVIENYKADRQSVARIYLHSIFHCILQHPFMKDDKVSRIWNLASDLAAENSILELNKAVIKTARDGEQRKELSKLKKSGMGMTIEKIYSFLIENKSDEDEVRRLEKLFYRDDHDFWDRDNENRKFDTSNIKDRQEEWKEIGERIKTDLETFSKDFAEGREGLIQNIKEVNRERRDYGEFLRKFAVLGEEIEVNDDEFDYIFYTYGMELYGNMPLIEPLEHREDVKIKDFVIAIDTSGSCAGDVVEAFLSKTYSILKNSASFFKKVNIHIIMCDAKVQQDIKITSDEEFEAYMKNIALCGFGGTDFRPVFSYVDQLIEDGEFDNLRGLIYFTDGYGKFPTRKPDYDVAFVFVEDEKISGKVPPWAIRLTLRSEDIKNQEKGRSVKS
ncbi:vWA domain-containing protein [Alkalibacter mobilis]|uniref:vWA domain-containing protein n=1 Tax=Alkalibacter mobilis TaxID=2787712 RepID=UPI00189C87F3|nr:VWA-like domain-containing protein [Alkalibacter mobilis]MBF7096256.1 hypothetical protein [Alkalibacter mobilis]